MLRVMVSAADLQPFLSTALGSTDFSELGEKVPGKVRDTYLQPQHQRRVLITTDRQSAFNEDFCLTPLKGQVLNVLSAWWFQQIADIMPTHLLDVPDPNVSVVKNLHMLPVEIIVRSYLTGSSKTAIWTHYNAGERNYCGHQLPDGMAKNQPLPEVIITPTTKTKDDAPISRQEIIDSGLIDAALWEKIEKKALALFHRGQNIAEQNGLILVDTKYEMGLDGQGELTIGDEVHTPDSSRYWIADSYADRLAAGEEPENVDKEFFRLWLREQGYQDGGPKPAITDEVRTMLASKYIHVYERVTGEEFVLPENPNTIERIRENLESYFLS